MLWVKQLRPYRDEDTGTRAQARGHRDEDTGMRSCTVTDAATLTVSGFCYEL